MNISRKILTILGQIKPLQLISKTTSSLSSPAEDVIEKEATELLPKAQYCYKYWASALDENLIRGNSNKKTVDLHGQLHGINHHFIHSPYPEHLDKPFYEKLTPRQMIFHTDIQFKELQPTTEPMKVFRCVGEKPEFFAEYPQYVQRLNVKSGDVISMKEYAYATSDVNYANVYLPNGRGITYEIEIPPGARVSRTGDIGKTDEVVFPRSSRFECIGTERVTDKEKETDFLRVKLRYILPDEPWRKPDYPTLD